MADLRPGVRALRLPVPGEKCDAVWMEGTLLTHPFITTFRFWYSQRQYTGKVCRITQPDGDPYSKYGIPLIWPAAYLLPLWNTDEDQTVESEKEVTA